MTFFEHQCVKQDDTILSALAKLDKLSGQAMVVFVQNRKELYYVVWSLLLMYVML